MVWNVTSRASALREIAKPTSMDKRLPKRFRHPRMLLTLCCSQDLPNAMNAADITDKLGLHSLRQRNWLEHPPCRFAFLCAVFRIAPVHACTRPSRRSTDRRGADTHVSSRGNNHLRAALLRRQEKSHKFLVLQVYPGDVRDLRGGAVRGA
jgi:hypothetical protein